MARESRSETQDGTLGSTHNGNAVAALYESPWAGKSVCGCDWSHLSRLTAGQRVGYDMFHCPALTCSRYADNRCKF